MDASSNGHFVGRCCLGFYALVNYIPDPLGSFLNNLRGELVTGCKLRAHLTLLPPRPLEAHQEDLLRSLDHSLPKLTSFEVTLGEIEVFSTTNVVYLGLKSGTQDIQHQHDYLARDLFAYDEPFPFHPHITLAQEANCQRISELAELARRRWREYSDTRTFNVNHLTFVKNVNPTRWDTLREYSLQPATLLRTA